MIGGMNCARTRRNGSGSVVKVWLECPSPDKGIHAQLITSPNPVDSTVLVDEASVDKET